MEATDANIVRTRADNQGKGFGVAAGGEVVRVACCREVKGGGTERRKCRDVHSRQPRFGYTFVVKSGQIRQYPLG